MSIILWKTTGSGVPTAPSLLARPLIEMQTGSGWLPGVPGTWTDITEHWRADTPIVCTYGIQGSDPTDRVASSGSLEWQMDNGARPTNPIGWTSPISPNRLPLWKINVPIRFSIGQTVGSRQYKFQGRLADAIPAPDGPKGERRTYCTALDWFDDIAKMIVPDLPAIENQTSGGLVNVLLSAIPPEMQWYGSKTIDGGSETFAWAFDGGTGQMLSVRERLNDIERSEFGYGYIKGGPTGTVFVSEGRPRRASATTSLFDLTDSDISAIVAAGSRDDLYQTIRIYTYPTVVSETPTEIYSTSGSLVPAGESISLFGPYRDQVSHDQIGAVVSSVTTPVPVTDYTMHSGINGTGTDLTADIAVTMPTATGVGVRLVVTNNGATDAYISRLVVRGFPIQRQEAVVERTITGSYGVKVLDLEMPFQGNINTATDIADALALKYGQPYAQVQGVRFCANRNQALFDAARLREPGDRITVTESVTGLNAAPFVINSCRYELTAPGILWCTWGLEQATAQAYWTLGVSQLGSTTTLGF